MDHAITWREYIEVRIAWELLFPAAIFTLCLVIGIIKCVATYFEDIHVNDEESEDKKEPYAGKTLGL